MKLGRIVGSVVSTRKDPTLESLKLLIVDNHTTSLEQEGGYLIAVDSVVTTHLGDERPTGGRRDHGDR